MTATDAPAFSAPAFSIPAPKANPATRVLLAILAAVLALGAAALAIGPVVLTLAALTLVPLMFGFFVLISRP